MRIGGQIQKVDTFVDGTAEPLYYVVYLEPRGFVILPADDLIEPIIAFARQGEYDPSLNNPLGALVNNDLPARVRTARRLTAERKKGTLGKTPGAGEILRRRRADEAQARWRFLRNRADVVENDGSEGEPDELQFTDISDVRVAPLLLSEWSQDNVAGSPCYNYYTPNNYVCGCVATAMAQLMRYHEYPIIGIGINKFSIAVDGRRRKAETRGGDGDGGPYVWSEMTLIPESGVTELQRQAIGTLCFDAGISVNMSYSAAGSGADTLQTADALKNTFFYSNAVKGFNSAEDIGQGLIEMVNPNLDGKYPVLFGITGDVGGHAIVCDGYGYNGTSMYHHLNMGWVGNWDLWYHLPNINSAYTFDSIYKCVYNVFVSGTGEIISGRVTDAATQEPIAGAEVTGEFPAGDPCSVVFTAFTDGNGIYALMNVPSDTDFVVTVSKKGYSFDSQEVATGLSEDAQPISGNLWGVDFAAQMLPPDPDLDGNGLVNILDFAIVSTQWLADDCDDLTNWCDKADIDMNHNVDMADLIIMIENWLGSE